MPRDTPTTEPSATIDHIDDPVVVLDAACRITIANGASESLLGADEGDLRGEPIREAWPELPDDVAADIAAVADEGERATVSLPAVDGRAYHGRVYPRGDGLTLLATPDATPRPSASTDDRNGHRQDDLFGPRQDGRTESERQRRQSRLLDGVPGIVYRCRNEPGWPMEFVSEGCRDLTGYAPEAIERGEPAYGDLVLETDREQLWTEVQEGIEADGEFLVTYRIETVEGEERWVRERGRALPDAAGEGTVLEGVIIDVTERKRVEHELEEILGRVTDAFFALDEDWRFTHLNERAQELINPEGRDLVGEHVWEQFPEATDREFKAAYERAMRNQETVSFEEYYPDPLDTWFQVTAYPSETGLSVYFRDVSDRKRREQDLERYETIVETMNDGVFTVDEEGRFTWVNREYVEMTGYDRSELIGADVTTVVDEETVAAARETRSELERNESAAPAVEAPVERADGSTFRAEARYALIDGASRRERLGVVRDVTERHERERELERRVDQQASVADLGRRALEGEPVEDLFADVVEDVAKRLDVSCARVLELDGGDSFTLRAGAGVDAHASESSTADSGSQAGYTLLSADPVVVEDVDRETRFDTAPDLQDHDVRSGITVVVGPVDDPWGVLAIHDTDARTYGDEDVSYVQSIANVLATAIDRQSYQRALERYETIIERSVDVHAVVDPDGTISYVTPSVEHVLGYEPEQVVGENIFRYLEQGDRNEVGEGLAKLLSAEESMATTEVTVPCADGTDAVMAVSGRNLLDEPHVEGILVDTHDVTERTEQARRLREQRDQLEALAELNVAVRDINHAVVASSSREELERQVCDRLASSASYDFAWIGEVDAASGYVTARASAEARDDVPTLLTGGSDGCAGPAKTAIETGETQVVRAGDRDLPENDRWRAALERGYRSAAAIPIVYGDRRYGVLTVFSRRERAFDDRERSVISQLGGSIGHAIAALDRKEALIAESATEIEIVLPDAGSDLDRAGGDPEPSMEVARTIPLHDGRYLMYASVVGMDVADVETLFHREVDDEAVRPVEDSDDVTLVELVLDDPPALSTLAEYGGRVENVTVGREGAVVTAALPQAGDVRDIVETLRERFPDARLASQRQVNREPKSSVEYVGELETRLTERQRQALETAYFSGYYDWPRTSTAGDLAEALSISDATISQHLRSGHRKLCRALFERDEGRRTL